MKPCTTFANGINPFAGEPVGKQPKVKPMKKPSQTTQYVDPAALQITTGPLPSGRALPENKYLALFAGMKLGQCVRCETKDVGKICGALRKHVQVRGIKAKIASTSVYVHPKTQMADTGHGRVWLLPLDAKQ